MINYICEYVEICHSFNNDLRTVSNMKDLVIPRLKKELDDLVGLFSNYGYFADEIAIIKKAINKAQERLAIIEKGEK